MSKFKKLQEVLQKKGYSKESAGAIAHKIGVEKYGKKVMQKAAKEGVSAQTIKKREK